MPFYCSSISAMDTRSAKVGSMKNGASWRRGVLYVVCVIARFVSAARLFYHMRSASRERRFEIRTLNEAPKEAGELCRKFVERWGGATVYRDSAYLTWRIFENPFTRGVFRAAYDGDRLLGWAVSSMTDDGVAYLVDVMAEVDDGKAYTLEDVVARLLAEAALGARNMGAVAIRGWHVTDHPFAMLVKRMALSVGFYHVRKGGPMHVRRLSDVDNCTTRNLVADWYITRIYNEGATG
jgi:hypothetical protein